MIYVRYNDTLAHHGIKGQEWGVRNGPPYPLDKETSSEVKSKANDDFHLTDTQKKAIKSSTIVAGSVLAAYGMYKIGALDNAIRLGKEVGHLSGSAIHGTTKTMNIPDKDNHFSGIKKLNKTESLSECLNAVNPLRDTNEGDNNCVYTSICTFLRRVKSIDIRSGSSNGEAQSLAGTVEDCFKFKDRHDKAMRMREGQMTLLGNDRASINAKMVEWYGNNAAGVIDVKWIKPKNGVPGHAFNWSISNGKVLFYDGQPKPTIMNGYDIMDVYWNRVDKNGSLCVARLDGLELIEEGIKNIAY